MSLFLWPLFLLLLGPRVASSTHSDLVLDVAVFLTGDTQHVANALACGYVERAVARLCERAIVHELEDRPVVE